MKKKILQKAKLTFFPLKENEYRPKFLESRFLYCYLILVIILKLITVPFLIYFPKNFFFADITKNAILELVNENRKGLGLSILKENSLLEKAAFLKAKDMLKKGYFSHQSPEGISPWYWIKLAGYNYQVAGENLAIGFLDSEEVTKAWLNSPSHRANLLNPKYQEVGIAVIRGNFQGNETNLVVQFFGAPLQPTENHSFLAQTKPKTNPKEEVVSQKTKLRNPSLEKSFQEIEKKEILSEESKKETLPANEILVSVETVQKKNPLLYSFLSFLSSDYYSWFQYLIYGSLILIIALLLINIFIGFDFQHRDLILKTLGMVFLLTFFSLLDKNAILQFIPHRIII